MDRVRRTDRFIVYANGSITSADYQALTLLYQPIIGLFAFGLYLTLRELMDKQNLTSQEYLHQDLESILNRKLEDIESDRHKLEAVGLLDTFYLEDRFIYELKSPLSAQSFVNDGILGQYLLGAITKERFKKLIQVFKIKAPSKKGYFQITKAFDEVFPPLSIEDSPQEADLMNPLRSMPLKTKNDVFDWRLLKESLPETVFDPSELSEYVKNKISTLHFVYQLDELEISEIYRRSVDDERRLDIRKLVELAREHYKFRQERNHQSEKIAPVPENRNLPLEPHERLAQTSPIAILKEMGGGRASAADLRIVERLIDDIGLNPGVVNVLLAYIAKIKDGILPGYDYFEKVGLNWKHNQINDAKTALEYVDHLRAQYEKSRTSGKSTRKTYKSTKPDITLDWFEDYLKSIE
ncbi:MAG: DnaD domain protein [Candidatus Izemoplasmatales bacterium]|nr:DnaD domain protein [Candidatus Izemoplasmatales bacterium]